MYILVNENGKKGKEYVTYTKSVRNKKEVKSRNNGLQKTNEKAKAFEFSTREEAEKQLSLACHSLRNFTIQKVSKNTVQKVSKKKHKKKKRKVKRKKFSDAKRKAVYGKTDGHCYICGDKVDFNAFEVEHKTALDNYGTNDISNLFCSCTKCNTMKGKLKYDDFINQVMKIAAHQKKENQQSTRSTKEIQ